MKSIGYLSTFGATLLLLSTSPAMAAQGKGGTQRGGQAESHVSIEGQENTNAQWSTDPEKGRDRAAERHNLHENGLNGKHAGKGFNKSFSNGKAKGFLGVH